MKCILWGAGIRGERAIQVLGKENVLAYIDRNEEKIGTFLEGVEVISFDEYKEKYSDICIVIAVYEDENIVKFLEQNNIYYYFRYENLPSELMWQGVPINHFIDEIRMRIDKYVFQDRILIYGINLFSMYLYQYMISLGFEKIGIISDRNEKFNIAFKKKYPNYIINEGDCDQGLWKYLLVTVPNFYSVVEKYRNYLVDDFYDFSQLSVYKNERLKKLSRIHTGKRCFIIGNGPSLNVEDLEKIYKHRDYSIGVNTVYRSFEKTKWRPSYYFMGDRNGLIFYENEIKKLKMKYMFIGDSYRDFFRNIKNKNFYKVHTCYLPKCNVEKPKFSSDITQAIYAGGSTVLYECIQIAVYMGFSKIYLLGADCSYKMNNSDDHFIKNYYADSDDATKRKFSSWEAFAVYQVAKQYAENHGIKIYNATRGGKLEVFERVDFDSLF